MAKNKQHEGHEQAPEHMHEAPPPPAVTKDEITIQGIPFEYTNKYAAGHSLNEAEANQLNTVLGENLRNNFASNVKKAKEEAGEGMELSEDTLATLRTAFAEYEQTYVFAGKRAARAPSDPVKAKARKMARETIEAALRSKGIKPADLAEGKMDELIDAYLEKHPEVSDEAKRQVEATKAAAADALGGVDLDSLKAPAEAPAT